MNKGQFRPTSSLRRVACPHLGRVEARHSPFGRPINSHRCFRYQDDGEVIAYRHQAQFCLHPDWASCNKLHPGFIPSQDITTVPPPESSLSTTAANTSAQPRPLSMAAQRMLSHSARKQALSSTSQAAVMPAESPSAISVRQAERIPGQLRRVGSLPVAPPAQNNWQVPILWMFVIIPAILLFIVIGLLGFVALRDPQAITAQAEVSQQQLTPTVEDGSSAVVELIESTPSATFIPISEVVGEPIPTPPAIDLSTIPTPFVSPTLADDKENDKAEGEQEEQKEVEEQEKEEEQVVLEKKEEIRPVPWPSQIADGSPDRIRAPRVGIDAPVIPVGSYLKEVNGETIRFYNVAEYAAGWHDNSSLPGFRGNVVLAGHHNQAGKVFQNAVELERGDIMFLDINDHTYSYIVAHKDILPETTVSDAQRNENGRWITQTEDERLTLVTCYPPDGNSHRVIIVAVPIK